MIFSFSHKYTVNSIAGEPFTVCTSCWDRVKDVRNGCRVWIHAALEEAEPGCINRSRKLIKRNGTDSEEYRHFEQIFFEQLEKCAALVLPA